MFIFLNFSNYYLLIFDLDLLLSVENFVANSSSHTVAWYDDHILFEWSPLLEYLKRETGVQHARCGKDHHRSRFVDK